MAITIWGGVFLLTRKTNFYFSNIGPGGAYCLVYIGKVVDMNQLIFIQSASCSREPPTMAEG